MPGDAPRTEDAQERAPLTGRAATIGRLAAELAALAAAGDTEGARYVYETIGRLLGPIPGRGEGGAVVDLEAERQRRAGR